MTIGNDMNRPTKDDILKMRRQMEVEEVSADMEESSGDKSFPDCIARKTRTVQVPPDSRVGSSQIYENALVDVLISESLGLPIDEKRNGERPGVWPTDSPPVSKNKEKQRRTG